MRAAIAATGASDDYDTLADAPRVAQRFTAMRDQLRELVQEAATVAGRQGCVTALQLEDGAKAATLSALAKLGGIKDKRTQISFGPLRQMESRVLPAASESTLLQLFGNIPVGHSATVAHGGSGTEEREQLCVAPLMMQAVPSAARSRRSPT